MQNEILKGFLFSLGLAADARGGGGDGYAEDAIDGQTRRVINIVCSIFSMSGSHDNLQCHWVGISWSLFCQLWHLSYAQSYYVDDQSGFGQRSWRAEVNGIKHVCGFPADSSSCYSVWMTSPVNYANQWTQILVIFSPDISPSFMLIRSSEHCNFTMGAYVQGVIKFATN